MADVAIPNLVVFIASLIVAAGVAGVFATEVGYLAEDLEVAGLDAASTVQVDLEIITDPRGPVYDAGGSGEVRLHVKNSGRRELTADPASVDVLLDGAVQPTAAVTITVQGGGAWTPGRVARIDVDAPGLASGLHRVVVRIDGHAEVFEFVV